MNEKYSQMNGKYLLKSGNSEEIVEVVFKGGNYQVQFKDRTMWIYDLPKNSIFYHFTNPFVFIPLKLAKCQYLTDCIGQSK